MLISILDNEDDDDGILEKKKFCCRNGRAFLRVSNEAFLKFLKVCQSSRSSHFASRCFCWLLRIAVRGPC